MTESFMKLIRNSPHDFQLKIFLIPFIGLNLLKFHETAPAVNWNLVCAPEANKPTNITPSIKGIILTDAICKNSPKYPRTELLEILKTPKSRKM